MVESGKPPESEIVYWLRVKFPQKPPGLRNALEISGLQISAGHPRKEGLILNYQCHLGPSTSLARRSGRGKYIRVTSVTTDAVKPGAGGGEPARDTRRGISRSAGDG